MARTRGDGEGKGVSQKEMVRLAIEQLGGEAKPLAIQEQIKAKFNLELPPTIISNYKSVLKRDAGMTPKGTSPRGRKPARSSVQLSDLEAVKVLVGRLGSDQVHKLVDVFA